LTVLDTDPKGPTTVTVTTADRSEAEVFNAAVNVTDAPSTPNTGDTVNHAASDTAVHRA
jgi:hypothetical protein